MRWLAAAFVLGALAIVSPGQGAGAGAPLESSKQGLRKLESGQGAGRGPDAKDGLRTGTPGLHIPGQEDLPAPALLNPEKLEKQRKAEKEGEERKNWLVNGVRRLEATEKGQTGESGRPEAIAVAAPQDGNKTSLDDPQYLLRLYEEQKKAENSRQAEGVSVRKPPADPFGPFLQGWLGNSPARGPAFDEFSRRPAAPGGTTATLGFGNTPTSAESAGHAAGTANSLGQGPAIPAPNPYLADQSPPRLGSEPAVLPSLPSGLSQPTINPSASLPVLPVAAPPPTIPEVRPAERKSVPPAQAEDKKYFPQLNRF
jgi:hypothetical protein